MVSANPQALSWSQHLSSSNSILDLQRQIQVLRLSVIAVQRKRDSDCSDLLEALTQIHFRLDRLTDSVHVLESQISLFQGRPESTDSEPSFLDQLD